MPEAAPTRTRLVTTAARLLRERGYHGVGLIELLDAASARKSSMYHAFPLGKPDLALAAADHEAAELLGALNACFDTAASWRAGFVAYCDLLATQFESGAHTGPLTALLFDAVENAAFRARLAALYGRWARALAYHAIRFGEDEPEAEARAETAILLLEGGFALARARDDANILRQLPGRLRALTPS